MVWRKGCASPAWNETMNKSTRGHVREFGHERGQFNREVRCVQNVPGTPSLGGRLHLIGAPRSETFPKLCRRSLQLVQSSGLSGCRGAAVCKSHRRRVVQFIKRRTTLKIYRRFPLESVQRHFHRPHERSFRAKLQSESGGTTLARTDSL